MSLWRTPSDKFPITFPENCSWRLVQSRLSRSKIKAYYTTDAKVNDHSEEESQEENVKDRESSILRFYAQHRNASQIGQVKNEIIRNLQGLVNNLQQKCRIIKVVENDRVAVYFTPNNVVPTTYVGWQQVLSRTIGWKTSAGDPICVQLSKKKNMYANNVAGTQTMYPTSLVYSGMCAQVALKSKLHEHEKSFNLPKTGAKKLAHFTHDPYKVAPCTDCEQPLNFETNQGSHYLESHYGEFLQPLPLYNSWDSYYWYQVQQHALFSHCLAC